MNNILFHIKKNLFSMDEEYNGEALQDKFSWALNVSTDFIF